VRREEERREEERREEGRIEEERRSIYLSEPKLFGMEQEYLRIKHETVFFFTKFF
jgi:hypothetical protein